MEKSDDRKWSQPFGSGWTFSSRWRAPPPGTNTAPQKLIQSETFGHVYIPVDAWLLSDPIIYINCCRKADFYRIKTQETLFVWLLECNDHYCLTGPLLLLRHWPNQFPSCQKGTWWVKDKIKPAECVVSHRIHTLEEESLSSESRLDRGAFSAASAGFLTETSLRRGLQTDHEINIYQEKMSNFTFLSHLTCQDLLLSFYPLLKLHIFLWPVWILEHVERKWSNDFALWFDTDMRFWTAKIN